MNKTTTQNTANDSIFGLLAASMIGPAFGAGADQMFDAVQASSEIYTDRYQAKSQKTDKFELGAKNSLGSTFGRSASGMTAQAPAPDAAASLYYHKLAAMQMSRRHAPRMAA